MIARRKARCSSGPWRSGSVAAEGRDRSFCGEGAADKEIAKAEADIKRVDAKLSNEKFVANAPEEIVEEEREKRDVAVARKEKNEAALRWLENAM